MCYGPWTETGHFAGTAFRRRLIDTLLRVHVMGRGEEFNKRSIRNLKAKLVDSLNTDL